jgi:hypothetical protein
MLDVHVILNSHGSASDTFPRLARIVYLAVDGRTGSLLGLESGTDLGYTSCQSVQRRVAASLSQRETTLLHRLFDNISLLFEMAAYPLL